MYVKRLDFIKKIKKDHSIQNDCHYFVIYPPYIKSNQKNQPIYFT